MLGRYYGRSSGCVPEGYDRTALDSTTRQSVHDLIKARGLVDVIIPRGGAGLITFVTENSTVPVIETGAGNCHIFVDESADFDMADRIVINAKTQRPSVCNAAEKLLVHERIAAGAICPAHREEDSRQRASKCAGMAKRAASSCRIARRSGDRARLARRISAALYGRRRRGQRG